VKRLESGGSLSDYPLPAGMPWIARQLRGTRFSDKTGGFTRAPAIYGRSRRNKDGVPATTPMQGREIL